MFMEGMGYDQAVSTTMANMTVDHQRNHNQLALKQLHQWKMAKPGDAISPPVGEISAPLGALIVKLEPEFALQYKGKKTAYAAWALKDTRLTSKVAGMGIHLLELGLQKEEFHDWKFCMIDVVTGECFKRCHKGTAQAVEFALRTQEELLISCLKKAS